MQKLNSILTKYILTIFLLSLLVLTVNAEDLRGIVNLEGTWKFSIGDNPAWANPDYNDADWDHIYVPRSWEQQGYSDYNGYAWYRKTFKLHGQITSEFIYLLLGYIDDADEVYLNGELIGISGKLGPKVISAFNLNRKYLVPKKILNLTGQNTIAVRVYDYYKEGGIKYGKVGFYYDRHENLLEENLAGYWSFETEYELKQRISGANKSEKSKVFVPGYWESNGYSNYNGKARYQTTFNIKSNYYNEELYLVLGFIDDIETVYLNGEKIGSAIAYEKEEKTKLPYDAIFRGYKIPIDLLKKDSSNEISVIVYDRGGLGGIYKGPIGIATKENFEELKYLNFRERNIWEVIFGVY